MTVIIILRSPKEVGENARSVVNHMDDENGHEDKGI